MDYTDELIDILLKWSAAKDKRVLRSDLLALASTLESQKHPINELISTAIKEIKSFGATITIFNKISQTKCSIKDIDRHLYPEIVEHISKIGEYYIYFLVLATSDLSGTCSLLKLNARSSYILAQMLLCNMMKEKFYTHELFRDICNVILTTSKENIPLKYSEDPASWMIYIYNILNELFSMTPTDESVKTVKYVVGLVGFTRDLCRIISSRTDWDLEDIFPNHDMLLEYNQIIS